MKNQRGMTRIRAASPTLSSRNARKIVNCVLKVKHFRVVFATFIIISVTTLAFTNDNLQRERGSSIHAYYNAIANISPSNIAAPAKHHQRVISTPFDLNTISNASLSEAAPANPARGSSSSVFVPPGCRHLHGEYNQERGFPVLIDTQQCAECSRRRLGSTVDNRPSTCDVLLLIAIKSAPGNRRRRDVIRKTWGNEMWARREFGLGVRRVFLLGTNRSLSAAIRDESATNRDILQWDFVDTYRNLVHKDVSFFRWFAENCRAPFVLTGDDDTFMHTKKIAKSLRALPGVKNLHLGFLIRRSKRVRDPKSKWYVSDRIFADETYPPYLSGASSVLSADLILRLHEASRDTCLIPVADAFVGVLLHRIGVRPHHDRRFVMTPPQDRNDMNRMNLCWVLFNFAYTDISVETVESFWLKFEKFDRIEKGCD